MSIPVLKTHWEGEQCAASAELLFMDDFTIDVHISSFSTHSANHSFLFQGAYGPVAQVVRQVEDLTIQALKDMLDELSQGRMLEWPEAIREPPKK